LHSRAATRGHGDERERDDRGESHRGPSWASGWRPALAGTGRLAPNLRLRPRRPIRHLT
jgi:hypothetical protein